MFEQQAAPDAPMPGPQAGRRLQAPPRAEPDRSCNPSTQDRAFIALQDLYRAHGGLSPLHRLAVGERIRSEGEEFGLEDLLGAGKLFGFQWQHDFWLPLFQLDPLERAGPTLAPAPQQVVAEWGRGFDGWALANWFVQPNAWLASHSPIECLGSCLPEVLQAARADRFIATG